MSIVPWMQNARKEIQAIEPTGLGHALVVPEKVPVLPKRAVIVHEQSSDDDAAPSLDASAGLSVMVMPSSLSQKYNAGLSVRQAEAFGSSTKAATRLDELKLMAEKAGLSVEDYLESMNMPQNERSQKESNQQNRQSFQQETSYSNRDVGTNSREEVAQLVRESIQRVPTNNEAMATSVMRDILNARNQAAELNIKIQMKNPDQIASLRKWLDTRKKPMSDLAEAILCRM